MADRIIWYWVIDGANTHEYSQITSTHTRLSGDTREYLSLASGTSTRGGILVECKCSFGRLDEYSPLTSNTRASLWTHCNNVWSIFATSRWKMTAVWKANQNSWEPKVSTTCYIPGLPGTHY